MRRLLILTAEYTGHGHRSISDSLKERLAVYEDLEVMTLDGFELMKPVERVIAEQTYGPITRVPGAWELSVSAGVKLKEPLNHVISKLIHTKLVHLLETFHPDCILSVHPMFNGSVLDILDELNLKIPFVTHEADLIDIVPQWFDPRISLIFAPSQEAYDCTIAHGMNPEIVRKVGFPVRSRFMGLTEKAAAHKNEQLTITVMSGSEGSGILKHVVRELLRGTDAKINVVCGRNKSLRNKLRKTFNRSYHARVNALGFVEKIQDIMCESDILIMRASPNSVMEGVALNKPIIVFGQLAGQELHNPSMLKSHGLVEVCMDPKKLPDCVNGLLMDNGKAAEKMKACQRAYASGDVTAETARQLNEYITKQDYVVEK